MYTDKNKISFIDIMSKYSDNEIIVDYFNDDESLEMVSFHTSSTDCYSYNQSPKTPRSHISYETRYLDSNDSKTDLGYFEEILLKEEKKYKEYKNSIKIKKNKGLSR